MTVAGLAVLVAVVGAFAVVVVATAHPRQQAGSRTTAEGMNTDSAGCIGMGTGMDTGTDWKKCQWWR